MDLTKFTSSKKISSEEIILNNEDIKIIYSDSKIKFEVKSDLAFNKYHDLFFMSPTKYLVTTSKEKANSFFNQALNEKVEGVMVKSLDSPYKSGLRTGSMVKLKDTVEDLDLVILAAEHGRGKRAGFFSSFYIGVFNEQYNNEDERYLTIGKVSSGIKELSEDGASLSYLSQLLKPLITKEDKGITYFEPKVIIQVKYQEIQKSPSYNSGYALRFPRIISLRSDKHLSEVSSIEFVESLLK